MTLGVIASIVILFAVVFNVMPKGFKTTHEQIGTGKPAFVFVYDPNLAVSNSQTEQMNAARTEINDQAFFLIARIGTPEGDQLIAKYRANPAEMLLFDPAGNLIKRQYALRSAPELMQWIN
ncbi:hypothetical protein [Shewanella sp. UCD-KL21]|uniref:hypothetical protein n=1 Tax=Shewanella sp. UCD-KL21 TaxID=1917164 RepID=UPI0020C9F843|nr:hypothetical protein [Shewanella sp. UCD-KL21]